MKFVLLCACIIGMAICAPQQMYMEFDIHQAPAQAVQAIPVGAPAGTLEVLLPVDAQRHLVGGPVQGFIKQEITGPDGRELKEVYYPFGFDQAAAAAPVAVVDPIAPAAPAAPAAPSQRVVAVAAPAARPRGSDDDDEDEED